MGRQNHHILTNTAIGLVGHLEVFGSANPTRPLRKFDAGVSIEEIEDYLRRTSGPGRYKIGGVHITNDERLRDWNDITIQPSPSQETQGMSSFPRVVAQSPEALQPVENHDERRERLARIERDMERERTERIAALNAQATAAAEQARVALEMRKMEMEDARLSREERQRHEDAARKAADEERKALDEERKAAERDRQESNKANMMMLFEMMKGREAADRAFQLDRERIRAEADAERKRLEMEAAKDEDRRRTEHAREMARLSAEREKAAREEDIRRRKMEEEFETRRRADEERIRNEERRRREEDAERERQRAKEDRELWERRLKMEYDRKLDAATGPSLPEDIASEIAMRKLDVEFPKKDWMDKLDSVFEKHGEHIGGLIGLVSEMVTKKTAPPPPPPRAQITSDATPPPSPPPPTRVQPPPKPKPAPPVDNIPDSISED